MSRNKIIIEVSKGNIRAVYADKPNDLDIWLLDYDYARHNPPKDGMKKFEALRRVIK